MTEMWERFSYYGMRALLILYLIDHFGLGERSAYLVYGTYTSLVYVTPLIGGVLADRWLGYRKAIQAGAVLVTTGHGLLALDDGLALGGDIFFYAALAFIVVGTGFVKANVSAFVGALYDRDDPRREAGFTLYYIGINIGAALGAIVAGWLGQNWGWAYGFGAAGIGMALGLLQFLLGTRHFGGLGEPPRDAGLRRSMIGLSVESWIYIGALAAVALLYGMMRQHGAVEYLLIVAAVAVIIYILWFSITALDGPARRDMAIVTAMIAISVLFWALYEQAGSSLNLFTERQIDRVVLGMTIPASMFQALNSIYIILLAPFFAALWVWLGRRRLEPSTGAKFGLGLIQLGAGFLVLVLGIEVSGDGKVPLIFILLLYLLHTTGELCLVPTGIAAVTRLSAPRMVCFMVGCWAFANAAGSFVAGLIASATAGGEGGMANIAIVYSKIGWMAVAIGLILMLGAGIVRWRDRSSGVEAPAGT